MSCECELRDGEWSRKYPGSRDTLEKVSGPHHLGSGDQRTDYRCRRCGATLEHFEEDRGPDSWQRSAPARDCECVLVEGTWGYEEPRSRATLAVVKREEISELVQRTCYQCRQCGAKLEQTDEDHAPTIWERTTT